MCGDCSCIQLIAHVGDVCDCNISMYVTCGAHMDYKLFHYRSIEQPDEVTDGPS